MAIISIRQAVLADVDNLTPLFDGYRQFYLRESNPVAAGVFLAERLARGESTIFVAEIDGRAVGFTQLYPSFSSVSLGPIYILNDLFVDPEYRSVGVGKLLLGAAADFGRKVGALRLALSTARTNLTAQHLYDREGWERDDDYLVYEYDLKK